MAMSSWPKRGGNETIVRRIIGTNQAPGYLATLSAYGAKKVMIYIKFSFGLSQMGGLPDRGKQIQ
jgi:hypothetical protein